jgi:antitoxin component YwqK of YwqJK toxin-antitoxin module
MLRKRANFCRLTTARWLPCVMASAAIGISSPLVWADPPPHAGPERAATVVSTVEKRPAHQSIETVRERYSDGHVKIEREVTLDSAGNYVNHGAWRMWDPAGKLIAEGRYDMGQRDGLWKRTHTRDDSPVLEEFPFSKFTAPFDSQATFVAGQLESDWVIRDAEGRQCSQVSLVHGKRHGKAMLWQPDGQVYREAAFLQGVANGDVLQRDAGGQLITVATYVDGHQLVNNVTYFPESEVKETEGSSLAALSTETSPDDFWNLRFADYATQGEDQRHGSFKQWYVNGQLKLEGNFQFDHESGPFVWRHANGQKAVEGEFVDGQQDGRWVWWYANGQKASLGEYHYGTMVSTWRQWDTEGRLVQTKEFQKGQIATRTVQGELHAMEAR